MVASKTISGIAKLFKSQRLLALKTLPEALQRESTGVKKAVRKENDPDKTLALKGL